VRIARLAKTAIDEFGEQAVPAKIGPGTFYLPPLEGRTCLVPGDIVKIVFRIEHDGEVDVGRMWVIVQSISPAGYVGALDNRPYCTDELNLGTLVQFGPEHVIQIHMSS